MLDTTHTQCQRQKAITPATKPCIPAFCWLSKTNKQTNKQSSLLAGSRWFSKSTCILVPTTHLVNYQLSCLHLQRVTAVISAHLAEQNTAWALPSPLSAKILKPLYGIPGYKTFLQNHFLACWHTQTDTQTDRQQTRWKQYQLLLLGLVSNKYLVRKSRIVIQVSNRSM